MIRGTAGFRKWSQKQGPEEDRQVRSALSVERCSLLPLAGGEALLHVAGRWSPEVPAGVELLAATGSLHPPVAPGPRIADGLWSASFAIDGDAADAPLLLVTKTDGPWRLPRPQLNPTPAPARPTEAVAEAVSPELKQLRLRCERDERTLADLREKLVKAWSEVGEMRELLGGREAEHELAAQRWASSDAIIVELEARLENSERELAARRAALESECERLQQELSHRAREGAQQTEELRAQAAETLASFEKARAESDTLRARLADARALADETLTAAAAAARELAVERARAAESSRLAEELGERLATAEGELAEARERLAALEAQLADAEQRAAAIGAENTTLMAQVEETQSALHAAATDAEQARRRIASLEGEVAEAEGRAEAAAAERATLAGQLEEAHTAVAATEASAGEAGERIAALDAGAADAAQRAETATAEIESLTVQLAEAKTALESATTRAKVAAEATAAANGRAHAATAEATVLRERLETAERTSADATAGATELTQERDRLAKELDELSGSATVREGIRRRSKVAARVYQEALDQLEAERTRAQAAEIELASTRDQLGAAQRELEEAVSRAATAAAEAETETAPEPEPLNPRDEEVEDDLRHLLAMRSRELEELRTALNEQRARYAAVASQLTPQELAETAEKRDERPWTALDEDLLDRIARAKELSSQD
jgi:DNA repair exonuclease SbcCD ATPase subunit